jgi:hypothetical protein
LHSTTVPRFSGFSARAVALLTAFAAALVPAFVLAPAVLAARGPDDGLTDRHGLAAALREAFAGYWASGNRELSPGLERVVDYWFRYHLVKAVLAALLLAVFAALAVHLWRSFLAAGGSGRGRRAAIASGGALTTGLALFSLLTVMANVQGAVAPFASLLPMLAAGTAGGGSGSSLEAARERLDQSMNAGGPVPAPLDAMIGDFALYHEALAVVGALVAAAFLVGCVLLWRRFARTAPSERRTRRMLGSFGVLSAVLVLALAVVVAANTGTAADPEPALLAFFDGGW